MKYNIVIESKETEDVFPFTNKNYAPKRKYNYFSFDFLVQFFDEKYESITGGRRAHATKTVIDDLKKRIKHAVNSNYTDIDMRNRSAKTLTSEMIAEAFDLTPGSEVQEGTKVGHLLILYVDLCSLEEENIYFRAEEILPDTEIEPNTKHSKTM